MEWIDYKNIFISEAIKKNKNQDYIDSYLLYSEKLFMQGLPIIFDAKHLAQLLGYKVDYFCSMAFAQRKFYRRFKIKKKNGKDRIIDEPLPDLKNVQNWILKEILEKVSVSKYAKAFIKGSSVKSGARFHRKQEVLLTVDIKDFFPSISFYSVKTVFRDLGYSNSLSIFLANLCTLNSVLPQGAPTSPALSNIIMINIDEELGKLALNNNWRYTRYADDITFSGELKVGYLLSNIRKELSKKSFALNHDKTRVVRQNSRQEVTGIVVNDYMQLQKEKRKRIRQEVYYIKKYGVNSHLYFKRETRKNFLPHLLGLIEHALFINPKDEEMKEYKVYIKKIIKDETPETNMGI